MSVDPFAYVSGVTLPSGTTDSAVRSLWEEYLEFGDVNHRDPAHPRCTKYDTRPAPLFVRTQRRDQTGAVVLTMSHPNLLSTKWWTFPHHRNACDELLTQFAYFEADEEDETA